MKKLIFAALLSLSIFSVLQFASPSVFAQFDTSTNEACEGLSAGDDFIDCDDTAQNKSDLNAILTTLLNLLSILAGIIAVVMVMIGGIRFMTSQGDAGKVSSARSAVLYAIVGVVVVAISQALVLFVLNRTSTAVSNEGTTTETICGQERAPRQPC